MARAHFVKKARKDYPKAGIKKGESYYWWKFRFGPKVMSKTPPKRSQLTQSDFLSQIYDIEDRISEMTADTDFETEIQEIVSELENLRDECQEKLDNMPEQLQSCGSGEILQNRVDSLEEMISELESVDTSVDETKEENETQEEFDERLSERKEEILDEIQGISYSGE